jgi:hypothetical protein
MFQEPLGRVRPLGISSIVKGSGCPLAASSARTRSALSAYFIFCVIMR